MPVFKYGGHTFEIKITRSGEETVLYDGEPVSSKMTRFGGTHEFSVKEGEEIVSYMVRVQPKGGKILGTMFGTSPKVTVFRNGENIYTS